MITNRKIISLDQFIMELEQEMFKRFGRGHRQKAADDMKLHRSVIDKFIAGDLKTPKPEMLEFMNAVYPDARLDKVISYETDVLAQDRR